MSEDTYVYRCPNGHGDIVNHRAWIRWCGTCGAAVAGPEASPPTSSPHTLTFRTVRVYGDRPVFVEARLSPVARHDLGLTRRQWAWLRARQIFARWRSDTRRTP